MLSPQALFKGLVSILLPQPSQDGPESERVWRLGRYGGGFVIPEYMTKHPNAREGSYFVLANPAIGTGVAGAVLAAFADVTAAFLIYNNNDANNPASKSLEVDFAKLMYTVAPATATALRYAVTLDNVIRTPTAGFAKIAGQNSNPGAVQPGPNIGASGMIAWAFTGGAFMTIPAKSQAAKVVANGGIAGLPVVGTEHMIRFGDTGGSSQAGANGGSTNEGPLVIPPGWSAAFNFWWPGNATTGPSAEYTIGVREA